MKGLQYYQADTNRYQDIRIRKLLRNRGMAGYCIYEYILNEIYRNGYYLEWNDDMLFIVGEALYAEEDQIANVMQYCCEIGLFDKQMMEDYHIATSKSIQMRFKDINQKAKRKFEPEKHWLLSTEETAQTSEDCAENSEETENIPNVTEETAQTSEFDAQSKVKKSKVKKSKVKKFIICAKNAQNAQDALTTTTTMVVPSLDDVRDYVKRNSMNVDAEQFFSYYQANGWTLKAGQPMRSWEAALVAWDKNPKSKAQKKQSFQDRNEELYRQKMAEERRQREEAERNWQQERQRQQMAQAQAQEDDLKLTAEQKAELDKVANSIEQRLQMALQRN